MKYGIVGSGEAVASVINAGLSDILAKDGTAEFLIHARKSPQGAVGHVYDYLIDNEVTFRAYTKVDDKAPKLLLDSAIDVIKTDDPLKSIISDAETILILWDDASPDNSEKICLMADSEGIAILDLTMALTPIVIESSNEEEAPAEKPNLTLVENNDDEQEFAVFSREELESMTIGILRRQAKAMGVGEGCTTKEQFVNAIMGDMSPNEHKIGPSEDKPKVEVYKTALLVWEEDGVLKNVKVNLNEVKHLLG